MTPPDDDRGMKRRMTEREQDALLRGPLAGFVAEVESLAAELPVPSPALYAMISEGLEPDPALAPVLPRVRRSRAWLVPVPVTALVLAGTVGAASADALPAPAQRVVSDTVASFTPIHLPKPAAKHTQRPTPVETPTAPVVAATAEPSEDPKPTHTPQGDEHRQRPSTHATEHGHSDGSGRGHGHAATPSPSARRDEHSGDNGERSTDHGDDNGGTGVNGDGLNGHGHRQGRNGLGLATNRGQATR